MAVRNKATNPMGRPRSRATVMGVGKQRAATTGTRGRRGTMVFANAHPSRRPTMHQRHAARLHINVKLRDGLQIYLEIGPAWVGLVISVVAAVWWPQFGSLVQPLLRLL